MCSRVPGGMLSPESAVKRIFLVILITPRPLIAPSEIDYDPIKNRFFLDTVHQGTINITAEVE
jgi:hypothetical protein